MVFEYKSKMKSFFVTGTDTGIGKTFVCSLLAWGLSRQITTCYYKPIQSGEPGDQDQVRNFIGLMGSEKKTEGVENPGEKTFKILESTYSFKTPLSPHLAARLENQSIQIEKIVKIFKNRPSGFCVVEGAGGIEVPINDCERIKDLMEALGLPVLLVASTRLGTINHTLLSIEALRQRGLYCLGLVLNDNFKASPDDYKKEDLREFFEKETGLPVLFEVPRFKQLTKEELNSFFQCNKEFKNFLNTCFQSFNKSMPIFFETPGLYKREKISLEAPNPLDLKEHSILGEITEETKTPGKITRKVRGKTQGKDIGMDSFESENLEELDRQFVWHPFTQHGIVKEHPIVQKAQGAYLWYEGKKVIDAISSWWVNLFGHCHPRLSGALSRQAHELEHILFAGFSHRPAIELSRKLIQLTRKRNCRLDKVFFSDNGSTSVEVALKMVYQYHQISGHCEKKSFLALKGSYHGDTLGAMSVGEREGFNQVFKPLLFGVDFVDPFKPLCLEEFFEKKAGELAAVIVEPMVQGASGMRMYPVEFLNKLAKLVKEYKVMVICDEVFTGFYRTGKMFAFEHSDLKPDLLCLSKGLTGGYLPLAVTLTSGELYRAFLSDSMKKAFLHGHSYTAGPMACQVACTTMELLENPETFRKVKKIEDHTRYWVEKLSGNPGVFNARQLGTIGAMEVFNEDPHFFKGDFSHRFNQQALTRGVLLRPLGGTVYAVPPYCVNEGEIERIYSCIGKIVNGGF